MSIIHCNGILLDLAEPKVMGIMNLTQDSFFDGGRYMEMDLITNRIDDMVDEGVHIIDLGAMSSRPSAKMSVPHDEVVKLLPIIEYIKNKHHQTIISIDTLHAEVAKASLQCGAHIINDISGGCYDLNMWHTVSQFNAPYVMMHMKGTPETMQQNAQYENIVMEVLSHFAHNIRKVYDTGIKDVIVDPGFGFSKNIDHNFTLLNKLEAFKVLELPLLIGLSRKSMIYKTLHTSAHDALIGTAALHMVALQKGAKILRAHDVKEARQVVDLYLRIKRC